MKKYAILLTVFNRIDYTEKCLLKFSEAAKECPEVIFHIFLTDDGSTDNTKQRLEQNFPYVNILEGTGNLYWCRGMINSWLVAKDFANFDGFFWINNDSFIYRDSIKNILNSSNEKNNKAIISGCFQSSLSRLTTYGGRLRGQTHNLDPNGSLQKIEWMNGNFVFVPDYVFQKIGMLDNTFWHAIGDYDYGLRAIKNGIEVLLSKEFVGVCEEHDNIENCYNPKISLKERFKNFYSPLGDDPFMRFVFLKRHYSIFKALKSFIISHFFVIFPSSVNLYNNKNK